MVEYQRAVVTSIAAVLGVTVVASATAQTMAADNTLPAVQVTGSATDAPAETTDSYTTRSSRSATKLNLAPRETPQTVSVITRQQMNDFRLTNINDALELTPGVTVEQVETDRTYYTARGFDITNVQYDGVGTPIPYGVIDGDIDTAVYDRIEVVKGATGLIAPMGDPSATINFVRKRPTREAQASLDLTVGSWDKRRLDADVAGPISDQVRGRLVFAHQDRDSYLDRYEHRKTVLYGALEGDLGPDTTLTVGHTFQDNNADSPMWGALPLVYSDGTPTDYDVSTSTSPEWSYWDGQHNISFVELAHWLNADWQAKAIVTRKSFEEDSKLFYLYGQPNRDDPSTGLSVYPSLYSSETEELAADVYAAGPFDLAGRTHDLVVGANWARVEHDGISNYGQGIGTPFGFDLATWDGQYPEPTFDAGTGEAHYTQKYLSVYSAAKLSIRDNLIAVVGGRLMKVEIDGTSYNEELDTPFGPRLVPYAGLIYDLNAKHSLYTSIASIYRPQPGLKAGGGSTGPAEGSSYEAGVKSELFHGRLNTTAAAFYAKQNNFAELETLAVEAASTYSLHDYESRGIELEAAGEIVPGLQVSGGYTYVDIEEEGVPGRGRPFVPKHLFRLVTSYQVMDKLKVGAGVNWQSGTYVDYVTFAGTPTRIEQDAYALFRLMAQYEFSEQLTANVNVYNLTDEKYINSLYWGDIGQGFYGAPRHASLTLSWKY